MIRVLLAGVIVFGACGPTRPRAGTRTIVIDVPISGVTNDMHQPAERCQPCRREQRTDEELLSCATTTESVGLGAHWDTMTCFFEAP